MKDYNHSAESWIEAVGVHKEDRDKYQELVSELIVENSSRSRVIEALESNEELSVREKLFMAVVAFKLIDTMVK